MWESLILTKRACEGSQTLVSRVEVLHTNRCATHAYYVGLTGLEPITEGPKSSVLPLHQSPIYNDMAK